ncbi:flagellar protein FliS [Janthinobacterium sp. CG_S6]|nr:flagellar protein FliS [Janthinobacterium sp. CG_S6]
MMFGTMQRGVDAYAKVGLETGVVAATPHKLVVMLFDGALVAVVSAQMHMKAGNIAEKGAAISKAMLIIGSGLRASLDKKAGGDIAESLDALYDYMGKLLLEANLQNRSDKLEEVQLLLSDLRDAWNAIGSAPAVQPAALAPANASILASA